MQDEILRLKREKDICILAHSYQAHEILEVADFVGDSFQLSVQAAKAQAGTMLMCGVRFMAETVKILSPEKRVLLSVEDAGCPMAEQMDKSLIAHLREKYPSYTVVAYINTTAELKTVCDVCVTSSSAVKIVGRLASDDILFIPDCNLGADVKEQLPEKNIMLLQGGCPVHAAVTGEEARDAKAAHPGALLLFHPECRREVLAYADFVGSTSAIMDFAKTSDKTDFIIGTELSIAEHLQFACPDKRFYPLSKKLYCANMRLTTLPDVYRCVTGGGYEVTLPEETLAQARRCIDEMIRLG